MAKEFEVVDIWLCRFPSAKIAEEYFHETYDCDNDDCPISTFAADFDELYYDHDFMERSEFRDQSTDDITDAIGKLSFSSSYVENVVAAFRLNPFSPFNVVLMMCNREITRPVSIYKPGRVLHYLGRFDCDPSGDAAF